MSFFAVRLVFVFSLRVALSPSTAIFNFNIHVRAGGHRRPIELCPTKLSMVSLGYPGWSPGRTCTIVITCCSGFASIQFSFSDDGKRLNPRTSMSFCAIFCTVVAICQPISSCTGYGNDTFSILLGPFTDPFLSGITGMFLHVRCISHQNSQRLFWASVCVCRLILPGAH